MDYTLLLVTKLSSGAIFLMGCLLLGLSIPSDPKLKNYRIARRSIACAYIVLALSDLYRLFVDDGTEYFEIGLFITLIIAFFQAFLFTYAMITLIDYQAVTKRKILQHTLSIASVSLIILVSKFIVPEPVFYKVLYSMCVCYVLYLAYCQSLFRREYKKYEARMDNFYSEDERKRLNWINTVFYMALCIGVLALLSIFSTPLLFSVFTTIYTVFYIYAGIKYINYLNTFHYISNIVAAEEEAEIVIPLPVGDNNLEVKIEQWIKERKYIQNHITMDNLAADLQTNRTYLSRHINASKDCNFKTWISNLRIEDAKQLLIEQPELPAFLVGELVGISDKSSFFRQFMNITGVTPRDYKEKHSKREVEETIR